MPTKNADTITMQRVFKKTPLERLLQKMIAEPPVPKAQVKRPSYLRYIEYV